jgi:SAM-dependent methyltransferase
MPFSVPATSYDRFMGRFSVQLSPQLADLAGVGAGQRVLDVGCGPGALTGVLVGRLGPDGVAAVDPSESFVTAARERHPGVDVRQAAAEELREMARVTRPGGAVAACVWDFAGGHGPPSPVWEAARELDPDVGDESQLPGAREGHLGELLTAVGLHDVEETVLVARSDYETFEDWWEPFELGVGPAGAYVASLGPERRAELRERCRRRFGGRPFSIAARAWAARATV